MLFFYFLCKKFQCGMRTENMHDASILTTNWAHEVIIQQHGQHKQYYKEVQQE